MKPLTDLWSSAEDLPDFFHYTHIFFGKIGQKIGWCYYPFKKRSLQHDGQIAVLMNILMFLTFLCILFAPFLDRNCMSNFSPLLYEPKTKDTYFLFLRRFIYRTESLDHNDILNSKRFVVTKEKVRLITWDE